MSYGPGPDVVDLLEHRALGGYASQRRSHSQNLRALFRLRRCAEYGLFANGHRADKLTRSRKLLDVPTTATDCSEFTLLARFRIIRLELDRLPEIGDSVSAVAFVAIGYERGKCPDALCRLWVSSRRLDAAPT